jgi:hypothetical protein
MAEKGTGWLEKHFWGAAQTFISLCGLAYTIWAHSHPYPAEGSIPTATSDAGGAMRLPLPLTIILVLLFVAFIVPNAMKMIRKWREPDPSHLFIHHARYGYGNWWWQYRNVTKAVRSQIKNNSINLPVSNTYFGDPEFGRLKTLRVKYSYAGSTDIIELLEEKPDRPSRLVLPKDHRLEQTNQPTADTKPALFAPLQVEAFSLAKELRDFQDYLGPYPSDPVKQPHEPNGDYMVRDHTIRTEVRPQWEQKLSHGFANRQFGKRITALIHRAGEEHELQYPALLSSWSEVAPPLSSEGIPKLAQEMEMIAIWINRKQRNEEDLFP